MLKSYVMHKPTNPNPQSRINIYVAPDDIKLFQVVGEKLHKKGVPGMLDKDGRAIRSAIIAYLLREKAEE